VGTDTTAVRDWIYALNDYDAGGGRASNPSERDCRSSRRTCRSSFVRVAVTPAQIIAGSLPTRPLKPKDHPEWGSKPNVRLDAIDPNRLTALVEPAIIGHVNHAQRRIERALERRKRRVMRHDLGGAA
jgi:hypothetical protein